MAADRAPVESTDETSVGGGCQCCGVAALVGNHGRPTAGTSEK
jgi:hypothetical protein